MFDALDLLRAHVAGVPESLHLHHLDGAGEDDLREFVVAQTKLACLLVTILSEEEGRSRQQVVDSVLVALMGAAGAV